MSLVDDFIIKIFQEYIQHRIAYEFNNIEVGKIAVTIVNILLNSKFPLSDDKIAMNVNISITDVRKILQILYRLGIVSLSRETSMTQPRYDYKWSLTKEQVKKHIFTIIQQVLSKLVRIVKYLSSTTLYYCPTCFSRYTIDEVYEFNFECPLDNTPLVQIDLDKELNFLTNLINNIKELLQSQGMGEIHE